MKPSHLVFVPAFAAIAAATPLVYTPVVSLGPNPYGPAYDVYAAGVIAGLSMDTDGPQAGNNSVTTPSLNDIIVTDYPSWLGTAPPQSGPAGAWGTALFVGVRIADPVATFSLADVAVTQSSTDPLDYFGYSHQYNAPYDAYAFDRVGILYGPNHAADPSDVVLYYQGESPTTLINELLYVGLSAAYDASSYSHDQAGLDAAVADFGTLGSYTITTAYSVSSGAAVPEPGTLGLAAAAGLLALGRLRRRR
jgi:MYXO-CTERM domain-containing protein